MSDSVPQLVKMISEGSHRNSAAICSRAVCTALGDIFPEGVGARRISVLILQVWQHQLKDFGIDLRRSVIVKVNHKPGYRVTISGFLPAATFSVLLSVRTSLHFRKRFLIYRGSGINVIITPTESRR